MKRNTGGHVRVTSEIHQVGGGDLTQAEDAAIYLLHFEGHAALVDAGRGHSIDQRGYPLRKALERLRLEHGIES